MKPLPTIICDSREQTPLEFTRLDTVTGTLYAGDYGIQGDLYAQACAVSEYRALDPVAIRRIGRLRLGRSLPIPHGCLVGIPITEIKQEPAVRRGLKLEKRNLRI